MLKSVISVKELKRRPQPCITVKLVGGIIAINVVIKMIPMEGQNNFVSDAIMNWNVWYEQKE
ncbi:hypothetical protein MTBBW1_1660002 [Desulfamplus magnetovallimortis]|uniref:Uncharacterized protein n=1 Tax=Desulfamplus magnetovallimortis TaxID=1246637 RepID=A0A1W1H930_9BACT|nr:hypothetical protein MTBBW1_1660002 [Desulfamplus magnetovallimortis]